MLETAPVGTAISINVGFAINNGANLDDYVRFAFDVTVTDPGRIVVANTIPAFNEEVMKHGVTGLAAIAVEYLNR